MSGAVMMAHGPLMLAALVAVLLAAVSILAALPWRPAAIAALAIITLLAIERTAAGIGAWRESGDPATLAFGAAHLARDVAWAAAIVAWSVRRRPEALVRTAVQHASHPQRRTAEAGRRFRGRIRCSHSCPRSTRRRT